MDVEILQCERNGRNGYKVGKDGTCHLGTYAWEKARKEQRLKKELYWRKKPRPLPELDKKTGRWKDKKLTKEQEKIAQKPTKPQE